MISCDVIDVGDTYVIPGTCNSSSGGDGRGGEEGGGGSPGPAVAGVLAVLVVVVGAAVYVKGGFNVNVAGKRAKELWTKGGDNTMV